MSKSAEAIQSDLREWRQQHRAASLCEIDAEVERRYRELLTEVVEEFANEDTTAEVTCPHCQQPMQRRGQQARTVYGRGGKVITLRRTYFTCPDCGTGLFPPG